MSEELKPCPFCGGDTVMHKASVGDYVFKVKFIKCGSTSGGTAFENNRYNLEKWNARHLTPKMKLADEMYALLEAVNEWHLMQGEIGAFQVEIDEVLAKARGEHDNN